MPSTTHQDFSLNTIRVKLVKQRHGGLGFLVKQRTLKPFVLVANIVKGGVAEESGLVQVGDIILRINDIDLTDMSYTSAVEVLKAVPVDTPVVMLLRGPEGYTTYLQTSFQENGLPRTVRITKAVTDSLMGRIKKTLSGSSGSMSPVKSLKKLCNGETDGKVKRDPSADKGRDLTSQSSQEASDADSTGGGGCEGDEGGGGYGDGGGPVAVEELTDLEQSRMLGHVGNGGVVGVGIAGAKVNGGVYPNGSVVRNVTEAPNAAGDDQTQKQAQEQQQLQQQQMSSFSSDKSKFLFSNEGRVDSEEETVLDNGAVGSPKIVLTSPKDNKNTEAMLPRVQVSEERSTSHRKAIEIVQDDDEITVTVRGDVSVRSEENQDDPTTPRCFIISTGSMRNSSSSSNNNNSNNGNNNNGGHNGNISTTVVSAANGQDLRDDVNGKRNGQSNGQHASPNGHANPNGKASPRARRARSPVTSPTRGGKGEASDEENAAPRGRRLEKKR